MIGPGFSVCINFWALHANGVLSASLSVGAVDLAVAIVVDAIIADFRGTFRLSAAGQGSRNARNECEAGSTQVKSVTPVWEKSGLQFERPNPTWTMSQRPAHPWVSNFSLLSTVTYWY